MSGAFPPCSFAMATEWVPGFTAGREAVVLCGAFPTCEIFIIMISNMHDSLHMYVSKSALLVVSVSKERVMSVK